jgi:hypothetical protein
MMQYIPWKKRAEIRAMVMQFNHSETGGGRVFTSRCKSEQIVKTPI